MEYKEYNKMLERLSHATFCEADNGGGGVKHGTITFGHYMRWGGETCCLTDEEKDMLRRVKAEMDYRAWSGMPRTYMEHKVLEF